MEKTPVLSGQELAEMGFKIVVYPLSGLFSATQAMINCYRQLFENGTTAGFQDIVSFQDFEKIIEVPKYRELEQQFSVDVRH